MKKHEENKELALYECRKMNDFQVLGDLVRWKSAFLNRCRQEWVEEQTKRWDQVDAECARMDKEATVAASSVGEEGY